MDVGNAPPGRHVSRVVVAAGFERRRPLVAAALRAAWLLRPGSP